jgi:NADH-quinone oxidoreductase subunit C
MTESLEAVAAYAREKLAGALVAARVAHGELTLEIERSAIREAAYLLRDDPLLRYEQLTDLCGVDYLTYRQESRTPWQGPRFAVVYHLLSLTYNRRVRLRAFLDDELPRIDSVVALWPAANWFEREAFDLFGIVFEGHPDLRRILTDYGFVGHPFRKDFPLIGRVEMRYDPDKKRVVYEPVSIEPRVLVPRVIREEGFARG